MNPFPKKEKTSAGLSLPKARTVRGYEVRRLPLGQYLEAMGSLQDFPREALEALFPGMSLEEVLAQLRAIDTNGISQLLLRGLTALPRPVVGLLSQLTGIAKESLLEDEALGLDGLAEVLEAWLEVNQLENFINAARRLTGKIKTLAANTGYKG